MVERCSTKTALVLSLFQFNKQCLDIFSSFVHGKQKLSLTSERTKMQYISLHFQTSEKEANAISITRAIGFISWGSSPFSAEIICAILINPPWGEVVFCFNKVKTPQDPFQLLARFLFKMLTWWNR